MRTHIPSPAKSRAADLPVSRTQYDALMRRLENIEDTIDLLRLKKLAVTADAGPGALVERMLKGEHPLRLWCEHRCMTLSAVQPKWRQAI